MISLTSIKYLLKSHSALKNLIFFSLIIFLFLAIYLASSWGITAVSVIQPHQLMMKWAANKEAFSEKKWQVAVNKLQSAIENNSNNAEHYFYLAALYDFKAYQKPIWKKAALNDRAKAISLYKKALELRPTWSAAWANLAMTKTLKIEFGDEVKVALSNALSYGPWEKNVFHKVLWVSMANWKGLPVTLQQQVIRRIKETVNSNGRVPGYIQQTADHFKWHKELKNIIENVVGSKEKKQI